MRKAFSIASLALILPLSACFDADLAIEFTGDDRAVATMTMVATPEFYQMATSSDDPFCEGEDSTNENGDYVCTETASGTIDEIANNPDMGEGVTIERRDGGLIYVAFDLTDLTEEIAPPEEEGGEEMINMMKAAFEGHAITLNVSGDEIVETNGTISEDGTTASYEIPLTLTLDAHADLPDTFNALLRPGG